MKKLLTLFAISAILTASSRAATYFVLNAVDGTGANDGLFQDTDNSLLDGGIVALGYFTSNSPSSNIGDIATTISDFNIEASSVAGTGSDVWGSPRPGYVQDATGTDAGTITGADSRIGKDLYIFVGNAATLGASTAFALVSVEQIIDDNPFPATYLANPLGGTPVLGSVGSFTGDAAGVGSDTFTTLKLEAIPESSTVLLGGLGALLLLRRRRDDA